MSGPGDLLGQFQWLIDNPDFEERPPGIVEFLGPEYLNIRKNIRKRILAELVEIFGDEFTPGQIAQYREALITGGIGIGKGQRSCDIVQTMTGPRKVEDLRVGDDVIGSDGRPTAVTGVFPRGVLPVYRVTFSDGASLVVDGDHLWAVDRVVTGRKWRREVVSTGDLMARKLKYGDSYSHRIPLVEPIEYAPEDLPIAPYLLGALLGNGSVGGSVRLADVGGTNGEFAAKISPLLPPGVIPVRASDREGDNLTLATYPTFSPNPLLDAARGLGLDQMKSRTKRIPDAYLVGAAADRLELLRGLMDTDGHCAAGNRSVFSTSSPQLAEDVQAIVRSLGGVAGLSSFDRKGGTEYHVTVNLGDVCPFSLAGKASKWSPRTNQKPKRAITSIVPAGHEEVICISVAAPDKLYVAGSDYVVTHNTTIASIVLSYMACCTLCLRDPQEYYALLPGSKIAFMMMSTKRAQALEVIFQDTKARIDNSSWFKERYPRDDGYKNLIAFPKNICIIPGDSLETTFEGYNILGGVMDEIDSHKVTLAKDYAESGYSTIRARITSRFGAAGFLVLIGQTKTEGGFAMRRMDEFAVRDDAYAVKLAIWESLDPSNFCGETFFYDTVRSTVMYSDEVVKAGLVGGPNLIEIPVEYIKDFRLDPDKALRDLAGIPRKVEDPFIRNVDKIMSCTERFNEHHPELLLPWNDDGGRLRHDRLDPLLRCTDSLPRVGHIDIAYSPETGDAAAVALGHISEYVDTDEGLKPYIVIDVLCRILPPPGRQLEIAEIREVVYQLADRGFNIKKMTCDGFQSTDTLQQFRKRRIFADLLSVDKKMLPYSDLRDAIYEERIEFPAVMGKQKRSDPAPYNVVVKELTELGYPQHGEKIDHPHGGTKDVADALAGTVHNLMLRARRGRPSAPEVSGSTTMGQALRNPLSSPGIPAPLGAPGLSPVLMPYRTS